MAFQVSPGVAIREIDLTNVVPAVSTSIGATVIDAVWGPIGEITTITSEKDLVSVYGAPTNDTFAYFLNAAAFLKYGNNLKVNRVLRGGAKNATAVAGGILIEGQDVYDNSFADGQGSVGPWAAKYAGKVGNTIAISVCSSATAFTNWDPSLSALFDGAPNTSDYALSKGGVDDEMHIVIADNLGYFTGVPGTILETFAYVSQASDAKKSDGSSNYYKDVINATSQYVWWTDHDVVFPEAGLTAGGGTGTGAPGSGTNFTSSPVALTYQLVDGADGTTVDVGDIDTAFQIFNDAETVDVNLLIGAPTLAGADGVTQANNLIAIAENRKDLVAFVSPPLAATVSSLHPKTDIILFADQLTSSSYAFLDSTQLKVYDKYSDVYRWIPASGHMAGLCANTDEVADAWFSPGGYNRGQLLGVTKLAFNPKKAERDDLYKKRVNPIVAFPGDGIVLFGDKTLQAKPSAFDRINVRRLFIVLEKAIATAAKYQLFELNDEFTRAMFRNMTEPFLREIKGRRGIYDFKVVCDSTNNTGNVIDSNQFVADIYIKPARSINFINLNFIATRTGVDFAEIGG